MYVFSPQQYWREYTNCSFSWHPVITNKDHQSISSSLSCISTLRFSISISIEQLHTIELARQCIDDAPVVWNAAINQHFYEYTMREPRPCRKLCVLINVMLKCVNFHSISFVSGLLAWPCVWSSLLLFILNHGLKNLDDADSHDLSSYTSPAHIWSPCTWSMLPSSS